MAVKKRKRSTSRRTRPEKYYGKHSRYEFPIYAPNAFSTREQAASMYNSLADQHRTYASGYIAAAEKREKEKGRSDRLAKKWRAQAKKDHQIAQRADTEALKLSQG